MARGPEIQEGPENREPVWHDSLDEIPPDGSNHERVKVRLVQISHIPSSYLTGFASCTPINYESKRGDQVSSSTLKMRSVWYQSVRWMGRGPTIQGRKNATDAVSASYPCTHPRPLQCIRELMCKLVRDTETNVHERQAGAGAHDRLQRCVWCAIIPTLPVEHAAQLSRTVDICL